MQRHDRALGSAGAYALGHLDQLVGVAGAERWPNDRLRLLASPLQHDAMRVVESRRHLDPAFRAMDPRSARRVVLQRHQQRRGPAIVVAQQQARLGIDAGRGQRPVDARPGPVSRESTARTTRRRPRDRASRRRPARGRTAGPSDRTAGPRQDQLVAAAPRRSRRRRSVPEQRRWPAGNASTLPPSQRPGDAEQPR